MSRSLALLAVAALTACSGPLERDDVVFVDTPFDTVFANVERGSVLIVAAGDERVRVERRLSSSTWSPGLARVEVDGGTLRIVASCGGEPAETCAMDHRLVVPADVAASLLVSRGEVRVDGMSGDLAVRVGDGDVVLRDLGGFVDVETTAGDVTLARLSGSVRAFADEGAIEGFDLTSPEVVASSGAGDISLDFVGTVDALDARTGGGDIDVHVPAGAYALDLTADAVHVEGVTDDPHRAVLHAFTGVGSVRVVGEAPAVD